VLQLTRHRFYILDKNATMTSERDEVEVNNEVDAIVEETFLVPFSLSILWVTTLNNGFLGH
jgi:hypothetical protein